MLRRTWFSTSSSLLQMQQKAAGEDWRPWCQFKAADSSPNLGIYNRFTCPTTQLGHKRSGFSAWEPSGSGESFPASLSLVPNRPADAPVQMKKNHCVLSVAHLYIKTVSKSKNTKKYCKNELHEVLKQSIFLILKVIYVRYQPCNHPSRLKLHT